MDKLIPMIFVYIVSIIILYYIVREAVSNGVLAALKELDKEKSKMSKEQ